MDRSHVLVLAFFASLFLAPAIAGSPEAQSTLLTIDSNSQVVGNVFEQSTAIDITANGTTATESDLFKNIIGSGSDDNGSFYVIELVADGDLRYLINDAGDNGATVTTGSRLPNAAGKQLRVRAGKVASIIGENGNVIMNITRVK